MHETGPKGKRGVVGNVVQEFGCLAGDATSLTRRQGSQDDNRKVEGATESTPIEHGGTVPAVLMQEAASLPTHSLRPGGTGTQTGNASFQKGDTQPLEADQSFQSLLTHHGGLNLEVANRSSAVKLETRTTSTTISHRPSYLES
jgi:hypothetical protein